MDSFHRLLDLPQELREHIYSFYMIAQASLTDQPRPYYFPSEPPLTIVSKLVRQETLCHLPLFYERATFPIMAQRSYRRHALPKQWFLRFPRPERLIHMRRVRLFLGYSPEWNAHKCRSILVEFDLASRTCAVRVDDDPADIRLYGGFPSLEEQHCGAHVQFHFSRWDAEQSVGCGLLALLEDGPVRWLTATEEHIFRPPGCRWRVVG